jgi:hypothetical protein
MGMMLTEFTQEHRRQVEAEKDKQPVDLTTARVDFVMRSVERGTGGGEPTAVAADSDSENEQQQQQQQQQNDESLSLAAVKERFPCKVFTWSDGHVRLLPEDFKFPNCTVREIWSLWWHGNPDAEYAPFRFLKVSDIPQAEPMQILSRARIVVNDILKLAQFPDGTSAATADVTAMSAEAASALFESGYDRLSTLLTSLADSSQVSIRKSHRQRLQDAEISFSTLYNQMRQRKIRIL